jgi:hypothetical protein
VSILEKVRNWIDGDSAELVLEQAARDAQVKPRSKAEEFIVKIAREVESVMQAEMVPLPQGTTIIPSEYTIFLSTDDDKEWKGVKRKGLEQGLYHILAERAKELAGKKKLQTRSFIIELRIDGTLGRGDVRVQHSWEDSANNKTGVLARPKVSVPSEPTAVRSNATSPIIKNSATANMVEQAVPLVEDGAEEMTRVGARSTEKYRLEIWRNGVRQNVIPIFQNEIVIGRGSKSRPVDIPLSGDAEISRRHVMLVTDGNQNFWVQNEGKNPAMIGRVELPTGKRITFAAGDSLNVCSYILRVQPR